MADGPVQTVYKGYHFRSRLEARWAVFMDCLGIKYLYEPEGFKLGGTQYLPDFYLPDLFCWIETKGYYPDQAAIEKAYMLADLKHEPVYILWGEIPYLPLFGPVESSPEDGGMWRCAPMPMAEAELVCGDHLRWYWCEEKDNREIVVARYITETEDEEHLWRNSPALRRAYMAARSARFEWGEEGCTMCRFSARPVASPSTLDYPEPDWPGGPSSTGEM